MCQQSLLTGSETCFARLCSKARGCSQCKHMICSGSGSICHCGTATVCWPQHRARQSMLSMQVSQPACLGTLKRLQGIQPRASVLKLPWLGLQTRLLPVPAAVLSCSRTPQRTVNQLMEHRDRIACIIQGKYFTPHYIQMNSCDLCRP
jgi:hypothetical protein